jgi:glycosyltransferase involved in cell wall biosynthesis
MDFFKSKENLLDIIIPVYNGEKYISECLNSLIPQVINSEFNISIIVVDDGSNDKTSLLLSKFLHIYDELNVITIPNSGVSVARNTGLLNSNSEWFSFVDADDFVSDCYIDEITNLIVTNSVDCIAFKYNLLVGDKIHTQPPYAKLGVISNKECIRELLYQNVKNSPVDKIFKRSCLGSITFRSGISVGEDLLFVTHYLLSARRVLLIDKDLYTYRQHPVSVTKTSMSYKKISDIIFVVQELDEILSQSYEREIIDYMIFNQTLGYIYSYPILYFLKNSSLSILFQASRRLNLNKVKGFKRKAALFFLKMMSRYL